MPAARVPSLLLAFVLSSIGGLAHANDGVMGGAGSDLVPMKTSDVSMVSEDIQLTYDAEYWLVEADYVFRNNTKTAQALQLGFPEYGCEDPETDCQSASRFNFQDMKTLVRGIEVKHRKGRVRGDHPWAPRLGGVWLFDLKLAPEESAAVRHTYRVPTAYDSRGGRSTRYVTRTGALWAGPITSAIFRVRVPLRAIEYEYDGPAQLGKPTLTRVETNGDKLVELKYTVQQFAPDDDLSFYFLESHGLSAMNGEQPDLAPDGPARAGLASHERCERFLTWWELGAERAAPAKTPDALEAQRQRVTRMLAEARSAKSSRRICEATVYAKYGKRFEDERLNRYFYGEQGFVPSAWPHAFMTPNPDFEPSWLGPDDLATLAVIAELPDRPLEIAQATLEPPSAPAPSPQASSTRAPKAAGCATVHGAARSPALAVYWMLSLLTLAIRTKR